VWIFGISFVSKLYRKGTTRRLAVEFRIDAAMHSASGAGIVSRSAAKT
jgi:hypothetical protein